MLLIRMAEFIVPMKKADLEVRFANEIKASGGVESWGFSEEISNRLYYVFWCKDGSVRYWTNASNRLLALLGIRKED